ncbi:cytoplasmic phosphatidylinositol transfer protein 1-like [Liolophura sinensis]|uniref:cytoplasmic phosphatidylinositol transfer protein 1-like n=1 Tax=Liolophura sinensis TaxID=3198878 RepID=UPI00315815ED
MMLKEYRICMPLTVEEYRIGQLYMIAKHSHEQSQRGEGVEVIKNEPCQHPDYGEGQYTEKRIYLSSRLPNWMQALIPNVFYITEKAWNFYPFTITEYTCSFLPRFSIHIETRYENNNGSSENSLGLPSEDISLREVDFIDIAYDPLVEKHYKEEEDCTKFKSKKTNRGPLQKGWRENTQPIMCSYKATRVKFEVWGLQSRVEAFSHKAIRDILQVGHRQAFAWIDEWIDMKIEDIRSYEVDMHKKTNQKVTARSNSVD